MKYLLLFLISFSSFADYEMWMRFGAGKGFSDFDKERHEESHMYYGGIKGAYLKDKWEYSIGLDALKYEIKNRIKDNEYRKAKHTNENLLLSISPKYRFEKLKIGPYLGRYLDRNRLTLDARSQDVLGLEADYSLSEKWAMQVGSEMNIDHGEKHKIARIGLAYKFGEKKKEIIKRCIDKKLIILFGFDKHELSESQKSEILDFSKGLKNIIVSGHTDTIGSEEYNEKLSKRRAMSVFELLKDDKIDMYYFGESRPSSSHSASRRVEIEGCN